MANIEINNLHPAGSELFHDSESFLNELTEREMWGVEGGLTLDTLGSVLSESLGQTLGQGSIVVTGPDSIQGLTL
ncbi:hypothetical protein [Mastigocladopsis repens]|uniref:hypothetical protein n=1 Tax=Mastigocladopsis repens TaxID=221287 RepID=UPI00030BE2B4|nr:hypothetical protein [Mastigocladopsis repens]